MEKRKYNRESAIELLAEKQKELIKSGVERLPKRADFTEAEVIAIKAFLGPWPRALEQAGIKTQSISKRGSL